MQTRPDASKPIPNKRQEQYALGLFKGMKQLDAYAKAGYKFTRANTARPNASRLAINDNIVARIAYLQKQAARTLVLSKEGLLADLFEQYQRARQEDIAGGITIVHDLAGKDGPETRTTRKPGWIDIGERIAQLNGWYPKGDQGGSEAVDKGFVRLGSQMELPDHDRRPGE